MFKIDFLGNEAWYRKIVFHVFVSLFHVESIPCLFFLLTDKTFSLIRFSFLSKISLSCEFEFKNVAFEKELQSIVPLIVVSNNFVSTRVDYYALLRVICIVGARLLGREPELETRVVRALFLMEPRGKL